MAGFTDTLALAASGMAAQSQRLQHLTENIANADTPGYRRKTVSFEPEMQAGRPTGRVVAGEVTLDPAPLERVYDPAHPLADAEGYHDGSNVDLVIEIADAREAQRSYEANLRMFDQTRDMSAALLDLLRR
ncbi:flagellar basal body rod protein FlgC [Frigidibacter oleivorans]|uniref:flagellar basal body rod protein FlgC n=1 Tax=Frigidibacter oleivorans TaxID=2487129 RepID=UPI000F8E1015|nr:flagellar basal body rod protein FlgC [Frigidibacter oleivorans]